MISSRPQLERHSSELLNLLDAVNIARVCLQLGSVGLQLGVLLSVNLATGRDDREGHQNVSSCERSTTEVLAVVRRCRELGVQEAEVSLVVRAQVHAVDLIGDAAGDRLDEEGHWGVADVWMEYIG